ncbi:MAG TPA: hypothetical protein VFE78_23850 [Gemmataceae bacterium]|nr:hypothetical protein [Gemmataceae bacterium]
MSWTWARALRRLFRPTRPVRSRRRAAVRPRLLLLEDRLAPATLTVTTAADDVTPNDGSVSLREALTAINAGSTLGDPDITAQNPGTFGSNDTIKFAIPGTGAQQIDLLSALPALTKKVMLDGLTQGGANNTIPLIVLNGGGAGAGASGLDLEASSDGSTVEGFVIQGFGGNGIVLDGSSNNTVASDYIGTNATGTAKAGNGGIGILIENASRSNTVGGAAGVGNVISGNAYGIDVSGVGTTANLIAGNRIGTDVNGAVALGNTNVGVVVQGNASGNSVGGFVETAASGNVISGSIEGVLLDGASDNQVLGNHIGTNLQGNAALGNAIGVVLGGEATGNTVGAPFSNLSVGSNVISGNTYGVVISDFRTSGNVIQSNLIGAAADGTTALGNAVGVLIENSATANTVGGQINPFAVDIGQPTNVISGNGYGVVLAGNVSQNVVEGNFIGTDTSGGAALGNTYVGVVIEGGAAANTVGGTSVTVANTIASNSYGVVLSGTGTTQNVVEGNYVGTNNTGTGRSGPPTANRLGNIVGVVIENGASGNTVGGTAAGAGNTIAFSVGQGVVMVGASYGDSFLSNSIFGNGGLGIDLGSAAPLPNGPSPRMFIPNNGQNFPTFTLSGNAIAGTLTSTPNTSFLVQFFSSPPGSSFQGQTLIGSVTVTTDAGGNASFSLSVAAVPAGDAVNATATNLTTGDTSEFSS